jgi:hypothetical protein
MPFAGFKDFAACQRSMSRKYKNPETAKKVCGKLQAQKESSVATLQNEDQVNKFLDTKKVTSFKDEKGDLFIKFFLLDDSVNVNDWGVSQRSIPQKIGTAIGKPIVLYIDKGDEPDAHIHKRKAGMANHPVLAISSKGETKEHAYLNQELSSVGRITEAVRSPTNGWWYGIGRITDKGVREAFEVDPAGLPFFTSSSIWNNQPPLPKVILDAAGNPAGIAQPDETQIEDWEFMHVALVDEPAYGTQKTQIAGRCVGDASSCVMHLRNASIIKNETGHGDCDCTKKAMLDIANSVRQQGLQEVAIGDTSRKSTNTQQTSVIMSGNENSEQKNVETTEKKEVVEEKKEQVTAQPQPNQNSPAQKKEQAGESNQQQLTASLFESLRTENSQLKTLLETQQPLIASLQQKIAGMEETLKKQDDERRIFGLSHVVQNSKLYSHLPKEEQEKLVQKYAAANMSEESLRDFIAPFETGVNTTQYTQVAPSVQKTASVSSHQQQVPSKLDYPATGSSQKVASSDSSVIANRKPMFMSITDKLMTEGF